jgi:rubrerythrin
MTAKDEEWLTKKQKRKEDMLTLAMMARVDAIDDESLDREKKYKKVLAQLKSLTIKERTEIRKLFEDSEGKVDTEVEFECPTCGYEWKADMDVGQASFFFPSAT